jgi:hypothetical protein
LHLFDKQARAAVPMVDDEVFQKKVSSLFQMEEQVAAMEAGHPHKPAPMPSSQVSSRPNSRRSVVVAICRSRSAGIVERPRSSETPEVDPFARPFSSSKSALSRLPVC